MVDGNTAGGQPSGPAQALLLFGISGDLARRMLLPSLYGLHLDGLLSPDMIIVGAARGELDDEAFRADVGKALAEFLPANRMVPDALETFLSRLRYARVDVSDKASFSTLSTALGEARNSGLAVFLSIAPSLYAEAIAGLEAAGLAGARTRVALEKPIGHDLASSHAINEAVQATFREDQVFRIDHYLGKETVQNLLALRFANVLFEPLWNHDCIDHIQISLAETVGLEGRNAFYDQVGALRDMVQNHLLQLLSLVAMEPPASFDAASVRNEKVKVLRALRLIGADSVTSHSVIGQYGAGAIDGTAMPGYREDLGMASGTETFVALKAHVDNWRWKGVPFYVRTGKRLPVRRAEVVVQFKAVPHSIFGDGGNGLSPNKLLIRLQPEESIRLLVMVKEPGLDRSGIRLKEVPLNLSLAKAFSADRHRIAYERLLLDFVEGDPTLFVRRDEVEAQWQWIDAIRDGWADQGITPDGYAAGSWGPDAAMALVQKDGVNWHG